MWVRKRLDIDWSDLAWAVWYCLARRDAVAIARRIEQSWSPAGAAVACLSVRSGFDLVLRALELPAGSEVLVSALTIPDMVRILEEYGLVAVPVDIDLASLGPTRETLERAVSPRARAILAAHLFGSRMPIDELVAFARRRGLLVFEDCAQAYEGPAYAGHSQADVSLFSFGTIKTSTALGGGLLVIRDPGVRERVR